MDFLSGETVLIHQSAGYRSLGSMPLSSPSRLGAGQVLDSQTSPLDPEPLSSLWHPTRRHRFYATWKPTVGLPEKSQRRVCLTLSLIIFIRLLHPFSLSPVPNHVKSADSLSQSTSPSHSEPIPRSFPTPQPKIPTSPCQHQTPPTTPY